MSAICIIAKQKQANKVVNKINAGQMWQKCAIYEGTRETIKIEQSEVLHSKCKPAPQTLYLQLLL